MDSNNQKYIVVHAGRRDDYQVAKSLFEANQLGFLVTDDYIFRFLLNKEKRLPIRFVKTSYKALFWLVLFKLFKKQIFEINKDKALSIAAAKIANLYNYDLLAYSYYALPAFYLVKPNIQKILFQLHPQPAFIKKLYEEEIRLIPAAKKTLSQEHELKENDAHFNMLNQEAKNSDKILCASSFTKYTLEQEGIVKNINVIPYGVDVNNYRYFERTIVKEDSLKVLFVGSLNQRKGIYYLLEAVQKLQQENIDIHLTIVGRGIFDRDILNLFAIKNLSIKQNISLNELVENYNAADVFVLPSLCEGFAQVILEAMATGLPVITTKHTSAQDVIKDETDGFVIPIRDSNAIVEKLTYLLQNPNEREKMGKLAFQKSQDFSWDRFKNKLIKSLNGN